MNAGKATKAESGGGMTSQHPRGAVSTEQRSGEAQRLKAGAGQQANLPEEPLAHSRGLERHKAKSRGVATGQPPKEG
jgi:hypothetical protein